MMNDIMKLSIYYNMFNQEFQSTPFKQKETMTRPQSSYPFKLQIEDYDDNSKSIVKKSLYLRQFGVGKIKPKNIIYDKEKLYEDSIVNKINFNKVVQDNKTLKVNLLNLQVIDLID